MRGWSKVGIALILIAVAAVIFLGGCARPYEVPSPSPVVPPPPEEKKPQPKVAYESLLPLPGESLEMALAQPVL